jgi:hypothetical protein
MDLNLFSSNNHEQTYEPRVAISTSHMRERIFFTHSDPHGAAPSHGRFLTGMPDDDLLQRPMVA